MATATPAMQQGVVESGHTQGEHRRQEGAELAVPLRDLGADRPEAALPT